MAANKRKQDEKHLKMLREMVSLAHNKQCLDCHQRGPTYVNMTIGSFVCTSCSGILRGLNPPHRVKSISMTSFTPEEMEFLKSRGNDVLGDDIRVSPELPTHTSPATVGPTERFQKVYLGLYDSRSHMEPDTKDENKIRDFMAQKYEKKRWYVAPTEAMHEEARKQNTPAKQADTKPIRSLGNSIPALNVANSQARSTVRHTEQSPQQTLKTVAAPPSVPQPVSAVSPAQPSQPVGPVQPDKSSGLDLLGDLFSNPPPPAQTATPGGGFADFNNFNSQATVPAPTLTQPAFPPASTPTGPGLLQPINTNQPASSAPPGAPAGNFGAFSTATPPTGTTITTPSTGSGGGGGNDRYAALADLDSVFGSSGGASVNWDHMSWGGGGGGSVVDSTTSSGSLAGISNSNTGFPPAADGQVWPGAALVVEMPVGVCNGSVNPHNPFIQYAAPVANPFGGTSQPSSTVGNPFMAAGMPAASNFGQFGGAVPSSMAPSTAGFGQFATNTSTTMASGTQMGMQNGGFGGAAPQQAGAWAFGTQPQGQPGAFPAPVGQGFGASPMQGVVPGTQFGKPVAQGGFAQPQQPFASWGQPAQQGNPFMSGAGQAQAVPPRTGSTNPFL